eukprot:5430667-Karenia_brevis.AAC.1
MSAMNKLDMAYSMFADAAEEHIVVSTDAELKVWGTRSHLVHARWVNVLHANKKGHDKGQWHDRAAGWRWLASRVQELGRTGPQYVLHGLEGDAEFVQEHCIDAQAATCAGVDRDQ